jgi:hypothetical protein
MAIEMIEDNELSALAPSRLGYRSFINDSNVSGKKVYKGNDDFANLFGSKARKRYTASIKGRWNSLSTDCNNIDKSIEIIEQDIKALIKKSATLTGKYLKYAKISIQESQTALGELNKTKAANCVGQEASKLAEEEAKFQESLKALTDEAVGKAKDEAGGMTDNLKSNKNILIIGGAVVVLGVIGYFIFKKK